MRHFLLTKVWPVIAGLLTASVIMMVFEFVNSLIYPFPEGFDTTDLEALRTFTATLPWTAYILVLLGWALGAFKAGCITSYLAKEEAYRLSFLVGAILTLLGIWNNLLVGHNAAFNLLSLPMFIIFTYLGHRYLLRVQRARQAKQVQTPISPKLPQ